MYTLLYIKYITGDRHNVYKLIYVYRSIKQIKVKNLLQTQQGTGSFLVGRRRWQRRTPLPTPPGPQPALPPSRLALEPLQPNPRTVGKSCRKECINSSDVC